MKARRDVDVPVARREVAEEALRRREEERARKLRAGEALDRIFESADPILDPECVVSGPASRIPAMSVLSAEPHVCGGDAQLKAQQRRMPAGTCASDGGGRRATGKRGGEYIRCGELDGERGCGGWGGDILGWGDDGALQELMCRLQLQLPQPNLQPPPPPPPPPPPLMQRAHERVHKLSGRDACCSSAPAAMSIMDAGINAGTTQKPERTRPTGAGSHARMPPFAARRVPVGVGAGWVPWDE